MPKKAVMLHELGHICCGHLGRRTPCSVTEELEADDWAREQGGDIRLALQEMAKWHPAVVKNREFQIRLAALA